MIVPGSVCYTLPGCGRIGARAGVSVLSGVCSLTLFTQADSDETREQYEDRNRAAVTMAIIGIALGAG